MACDGGYGAADSYNEQKLEFVFLEVVDVFVTTVQYYYYYYYYYCYYYYYYYCYYICDSSTLLLFQAMKCILRACNKQPACVFRDQ